MYAIIKTGGKQYRVQKDDVFKIEKINAEAGDTVTFDEVIAVGGDTLTVGTPFVEGTAVHAEVVEQGKNDKVIIYKYKAKKDYRKKNGHRQPYTLVKVTDIVSGGQKAAAAEKQDDVKPSMSMKKEELLAIANEKGIEVSSKATKAEILEAIASINAEGRPVWKPMHMQPIYRLNPFVVKDGNGRARSNAYIAGSVSDVGMDIFNRGLCLPSDNKMTVEQQERIIEVIRACFE